MITLFYTIGNGYRCGCCGDSREGHRDFETTEEAIAYCVERYTDDDDDFSLDEVRGWPVDDDPENKYGWGGHGYNTITTAGNKAIAGKKEMDEIVRIKSSIKEIDYWLKNLDKKIEAKTKLRVKLKKELAEVRRRHRK